MNHTGLVGGLQNTMVINLVNGQMLEFQTVIKLEKIQIVGKKSLVGLYLILISIWNLMIDGLIEEI